MPKPDRTSNQYNITATVIDGTIRLSGDIVSNAVEVPRNEGATVTIADTDTHYLYASGYASNGSTGACWSRTASAADNTFDRVNGDNYNIVYAVEKSNPQGITYGPVITVKPKG